MKRKIINTVGTLILATLFITVFGGVLVFIGYQVIAHFSIASVVAGLLAAIIPALLVYGCVTALIEYIKRDVLK